jgi:hypothetical protein
VAAPTTPSALYARHRPGGARAEDPVRHQAQAALDPPHRDRARPAALAGAARALSGAGAAQDAPGGRAGHAVHAHAVAALEAPQHAHGRGPEDAVGPHAEQALEAAHRRAAVAALEGGGGRRGRARSGLRDRRRRRGHAEQRHGGGRGERAEGAPETAVWKIATVHGPGPTR